MCQTKTSSVRGNGSSSIGRRQGSAAAGEDAAHGRRRRAVLERPPQYRIHLVVVDAVGFVEVELARAAGVSGSGGRIALVDGVARGEGLEGPRVGLVAEGVPHGTRRGVE